MSRLSAPTLRRPAKAAFLFLCLFARERAVSDMDNVADFLAVIGHGKCAASFLRLKKPFVRVNL